MEYINPELIHRIVMAFERMANAMCIYVAVYTVISIFKIITKK